MDARHFRREGGIDKALCRGKMNQMHESERGHCVREQIAEELDACLSREECNALKPSRDNHDIERRAAATADIDHALRQQKITYVLTNENTRGLKIA